MPRKTGKAQQRDEDKKLSNLNARSNCLPKSNPRPEPKKKPPPDSKGTNKKASKTHQTTKTTKTSTGRRSTDYNVCYYCNGNPMQGASMFCGWPAWGSWMRANNNGLSFPNIAKYICYRLGESGLVSPHERHSVHQFLIVMLVEGLLQIGPYWQFFSEAVYFCDETRRRVVDLPTEYFCFSWGSLLPHIGVLWGCYVQNACFDFQSLCNAIWAATSCEDDQLFEKPDTGTVNRCSCKPACFFKFARVGFAKAVEYNDWCVSEM